MSTFESIILFTALCVVECMLLAAVVSWVFNLSNRTLRAWHNLLGVEIVNDAIAEYSRNHPEVIQRYKEKVK